MSMLSATVTRAVTVLKRPLLGHLAVARRAAAVPFITYQPLNKSAGRPKVTLQSIQHMYRRNEPISMMTAQDYPSGLMVEQAGIDLCLVGDSLAMVSLGYDSTNPLTVDEMLHHCRAVVRGCKAPFVVGDLPYGSYEASPEDAVKVSLRFLKEGHVDAVKLEGGVEMAETIRRITTVGIPVLAHIGLTPQRQSALGGFRVQGKTAKQAAALVEDAYAVQEAGAFGVVLEAMPAEIAAYITSKLKIPTIGIGAGRECAGQVLVQNDALGYFDRFVPKFTKQYCNLNQIITTALRQYHEEVKTRQFPTPQNTYPIDVQQLEKFYAMEREKTDCSCAGMESRGILS
ncbi:ketopantoate hydroxymethyltransferase-domain-containing protein [Mycotypha africana]|uniref:ketopantoate hydroxymethyltransferase-domain-containing protein n=1 Tax=Mycotypha africana TaxID=64632 RepID=UPI002301EF7E|nr:ketopantoate hydroxymethyltransferase-domain-containing protein [Mycotypha africana]KAI8988207.1 ketopantoate hydroxymethyltransferase-domain-containing protein [Mycotypha africana]